MVRPTSRRQLLAGGCAALGVTTVGCTGPLRGDGDTDEPAGDGQAGAAAVVAVGPGGDPGFDPEEVEVQRGEVVRWEWLSDGHTVTPQTMPEGATWRGVPDQHEAGHAYEFRFDVIGPYQYVCDAHPAESNGIVHVR